MKVITTIISMFLATQAIAGTVMIQPGQCVNIGTTEVCAAQSQEQLHYQNHQPQAMMVEPVQEISPYAFCRLTENKAPNTWDLYRQGGNNKRKMDAFVKSFAHFEYSKCQEEADKINERS